MSRGFPGSVPGRPPVQLRAQQLAPPAGWWRTLRAGAFSSGASRAARPLPDPTGRAWRRSLGSKFPLYPTKCRSRRSMSSTPRTASFSWLPDLRPWAATVAHSLAPGGVFHVIDGHPTAWIFDDEALEPLLRVRYPYFGDGPLRFEEHGSYAAPDADVTTVSYSWAHTFEEIVGSLLAEGLVIESLRNTRRRRGACCPGWSGATTGSGACRRSTPRSPCCSRSRRASEASPDVPGVTSPSAGR